MAAVIYNNDGETSLIYSVYPETNIPSVFMSRDDGEYLLGHNIGQIANISTIDQPLPLEASTLNSHYLCLEAGRYQFAIYDSGGEGICCNYGEGWYKVISEGNVIVQGGNFSADETTIFNIPFTGTSGIPSTPHQSSNSSISGYAFFDSKNDGMKDVGSIFDHGMYNISVSLLDCSDEKLMFTKTTDTGYYSFEGLNMGQYYIHVQTPEWYVISDVWSGKLDSDGVLLHEDVDSSVDPSTGNTACFELGEGKDASFSVGFTLQW